MVFVDTDVLSIFAKIQRLPLLFVVFNQERLHIALAVENEVKMGALKGFHVAQDITVLLTQKQIQTHRPLPILRFRQFMSVGRCIFQYFCIFLRVWYLDVT